MAAANEPTPLTAYQQTYHWRNKNCAPYAHQWFKTELLGITASEGTKSFKVVEVTSVNGDCDLGQRKGKLLTIYDLEVDLKWEGEIDGTEVKGTLKVPEVSHEAIDGLSDYVFDFNLTSATDAASTAVYTYIRSALPPLLTEKFNAFRPALLASQGTVEATPTASGSSTPAPATSAPPAKADEKTPPSTSTSTPAPAEEKKKSVGSTATVEVKADLQASADDIWGLLTDEKRIPMWSRSPAKMSLTPDSPFELFAGNITGKIISAEPPTKLVQSWQTKSPSWPSDHFGTMTITLKQGSDSTATTFTLDGVPVGQEATVEKALETYYLRGLKQMGLGSIL